MPPRRAKGGVAAGRGRAQWRRGRAAAGPQPGGAGRPRARARCSTEITAHRGPRASPGRSRSSTTLLRGEKPFTAAYYGEMALEADELQYEEGYGPCMDAGRGGVVLRVDDMRTEQRWPDYVARVPQRRRAQLAVGAAALPGRLDRRAEHLLVAGRRRSPPRSRCSAGRDVAEAIAVAVVNADAHHRLVRAGPQHAAGHGVAGGDRAGQGRADGPAPGGRGRGVRDPPRRLAALQPQAARDRRRASWSRPGRTGPGASRPESRDTRNSRAASLSTLSATSTAVGRSRDRPPVDQRLPAAGAQGRVDDDVPADRAERAGRDGLGERQRVVHHDPGDAVGVARVVEVLLQDRGGGRADRAGRGEPGDALARRAPWAA